MPMGATGGAPPSVPIKTVELSRFKGVDFTSSDVNVDLSRSPEAPNMMPDADGFPCKRPGYHTVVTLEGRVFGAYSLFKGGVTYNLVHAGTKLYKITQQADGTESAVVLYSAMAENESSAVQLKEKLWIFDAKAYLYFDGTKVAPVSEIATVPKITTAKAPNGKDGATSYLPINLLTGKKTDSFVVKEADKATTDFYLSQNALLDTAVTAKLLDAQGNWIAKAEGADFTVSRTIGKVTFKTAPGKGPVEGEDSVQITYETKSNADKINKCRFCILYGVKGALDRVFAVGSAAEPNVDYWSEWNDPAYFGDTNYGILGSEASPIMGYSILNDCIVAHKQNEENGRNAFVREGSLDKDGFAVFSIKNVLQGDGAVASRSFASLATEPMFLTGLGVTALTPSDITGERYAQNRSYFINSAISKAEDLQSACATSWGRFYVLSVGDRFYLLDSQQKSYEKKGPNSTYQYECYYFDGIAATCIWVQSGRLRFGTADGKVKEFYAEGTVDGYNDDGEAIAAYWTTPLMNLGTWGQLKTVTDVFIVGKPYTRSGGRIYYATEEDPGEAVKEYDIDIFNWNDIDFDRFTFCTMDSPTVVSARKKKKKIKLFQLKVENDRLNEPFGVLAMQINYKMGGKVKR